MADSFGMKATVTYVENDGRYDLGVTYNDSTGTKFDRRLRGSARNIDTDLVRALGKWSREVASDGDLERPDEDVTTSTPRRSTLRPDPDIVRLFRISRV